MDLETAEIIIPQYYQRPCSEKRSLRSADPRRLPLVTQQRLTAALLQRGVQLMTGWDCSQVTLWLSLLLSEPQGPWQCQALAWAVSHMPTLGPHLLSPGSSAASMRWELVFAFPHPWTAVLFTLFQFLLSL